MQTQRQRWMRKSLFAAGLLGVLCLGAAPASRAADEPAKSKTITRLPVLPAEIHEALQDRDFAKAVELIDAALKEAKTNAKDYLLYLKGRALTDQKQYDQALETFLKLEKDYPKSDWLSRSRFGRAEVFQRKRDYQKAGEIYQAEAQRLLSDGRRDELTGIYLEFAKRYFEGVPVAGPTSEKKPDYQLALTYYQESLKLRPSLKLRQEIELKIARCHQELGQFDQAIAAYEKFLKDYASPKTDDRLNAPADLEIEARYRLGKTQLAQGHSADARKTWQDFLRSPLAKKADKDRIAQITYELAHTFGVPSPGSESAMELGVAALERFLKEFPQHKLAAKAQLEIAQSYIAFRRFDRAIDRLKQLIKQGSTDDEESIAGARRLLGESYFAQKKFTEAIAAWREFLDEHPSHPTWSAVQRQVIDAEFQRAEEAREAKNYAEARKLWSTFLNKYPLDDRASLILLRFGQMKLAEGNACITKDDDKAKADPKDPKTLPADCQKLFDEAIEDWKRLTQKYPDTANASQAAYLIGVTLEDHLGRLSDALEAYKKVTGDYQANAQQRIANLTAKQLEVVTERKFLTDEAPEIVVTSRNLEKLSIKIYRIDMADYFRKMHLATGIETLDIALIDPDKSWEYEVKDYEKYRQFTNHIPIPNNGPGVTAVTVSSDKQEATTMLIVSDIDIIVKTSRNELFVFAENMRTKKPAAGVSILVSDAEKVFAEELTGADGVLQKSYEPLKTAEDLRVFAIHEGHAASTVTALSGLQFAVGLSPQGYLYTDRPAYRAGELVNLKGVVRWVADDQFTFKPGEKYTLDIYDSRSRVIHTAKVQLSEFGTFAHHVTLPESAPQGDYRVHLYQPGQTQSYEARFQVHETRLEPVQIVVDLDEDIVYRGEKITGKITLQYYYGTPLADRTLRYQLSEGRVHTASTDAKGQIAFEFDTAEFSESAVLPLLVSFPERNLQTRVSVFLATRGFGIDVSTLRKVFIVGEPFDASLKVTDAAGKPVSTELTLEVFERTRVEHQTGERLIASYPVKSDEKTGEARQTLKLENAGVYILRASATDRFGNRVAGGTAVKISGEDDNIRLRIFAEKQHYKVGDEAALTLHWREKPALALLTYEGAKILGYRLVNLKTGANPLKLPLDAKLSPNFRLSAAVMHAHHFHVAQTDFLVERELNIALKPTKTTLKPGEELEVGITVTDPQGQPVSAELSLGLIQKNLLEAFAENQPAIQKLYSGGIRQPAMRVQTSTTFEYHPKARGISQFLLAEEERREILNREIAALRGLASSEQRNIFIGGGLAPDQPIRALLQAREESLITGATSERIHFVPDEVEEIHGPLFDNTRRTGGGGSFARLSDVIDAEDLRSGRISIYDGKLSLVIRQHQRVLDGQMASPNGEAGDLVVPLNQSDLSNPEIQKAIAGWKARFGAPNAPVDGPGPGIVPSNGNGVVIGLATPERFQMQAMSQQQEQKEFSFYFGLNRDGGNNSAPLQHRSLQQLSQLEGTVVGLNSMGEMQVVNGLPMQRLEELNKAGLQMLPAMGAAETGYWNPVIVTGQDGKAKITFRLPERSTAWRLQSRAVTKDTLTGESDLEIITKKDLFGEIKTPLAFMASDKARVIVEVHNAVVAKGETIHVIFKAKLGEKTTELRKTLESKGPGVEEVQFPISLEAAGETLLTVNVESGMHKDETTASVPVEPFGLPVFATASGTAAQNTIAFVGFDKTTPAQNPGLEIVVGPTVNRALIDAVLGSEEYGAAMILPENRFERAISDVLGGTAVLKMLQASQNTDSPEAEALAGRVQSGIASLVSSQRDDGGWSWSGKPGASASDQYLSSRAVWRLRRLATRALPCHRRRGTKASGN